MRLLLDTNIIIDFLQRREPYYEDARMLFMLGRLREHELWFSSAQANDIFYTLSGGGKKARAAQVVKALRLVREAAHVCGIDEAEFDAALDSTWPDLEDACVYQAALKVKADAIITRNQADFEKSSIRVFDCGELFEWLAEERGLTYDWVSC